MKPNEFVSAGFIYRVELVTFSVGGITLSLRLLCWQTSSVDTAVFERREGIKNRLKNHQDALNRTEQSC